MTLVPAAVGSAAWAVSALLVVVVVVGAAIALRPRAWQLRHPARTLRLQSAVFAAGGAVAIVVLVQMLARSVAPPPAGTHPNLLLGALPAIGAGACLFLLGGAIGACLAHRDPMTRVDREANAALAALVEVGAYQHVRRRGTTITFVEGSRPMACSSRRPTPHVVITRGLRDRLTASQMEAVLAHEEHHLAARHDRHLRRAQLLVTCLPMQASRAHERRVRLLIELASDDHAARCCGRSAIIEALETMAHLQPETGAAARAERLAQLSR